MKNLNKIAIITASVMLFANGAFADSKKKVVASYNGIDVTEQQIMQHYSAAFEMQPSLKGKSFEELDPKMSSALVNSYVNEKIYLKEAEKLGLENSPEFKQQMKMARFQLLQQTLMVEHIKKTVTDKMIDEAYKKRVEELKGQKEAKLRVIVVKTEKEAQNIRSKLKSKGVKFADLAKQYSVDNVNKENGGELNYVLKEQLPPELGSKAFSMKKAQISEPIKSGDVWYIIELMDTRPVQISEESLKEQIRMVLNRQSVEEYIKRLRDNAKVKVNI